MTGKKFARITLILTAVLLSSVATVNILIDPLFQYHKPWFGMKSVITNERYQNAGVIKNFDFDNVVMGNSFSENFRLSEVDNIFGGTSSKLTMNGSTALEWSYILSLLYDRSHHPEVIMMNIDPYVFKASTEQTIFPFPSFLYNKNIVDDVEYMFNYSIFNDFTVETINRNIMNDIPENDTLFMWENDFKIGKDYVLKDYQRPKISKENPDINAYVENTTKNLTLLTKYIDLMRETEFIFFVSPFSMAYWDEQSRLNSVAMQKAAYIEMCKVLTCRDNVKLYIWTDDEMLCVMSNLDNYKDTRHYSAAINSDILNRIKENRGLISKENYDLEIERLFRFIETFDYDSLFL